MNKPFFLLCCARITVIGGLSSALSTSTVLSQTSATPAGTTNALFVPLTLAPAPNEMRLANGAPGPKYWQNRADYDLKATLDPIAGILRGALVLRYTNNSPHTLDFIWMQTARQSIASDTIPYAAGADTRPRQGRIETLNQLISNKPVPLTLEGQHGLTKVLLARPLSPGQTATFEVTWVMNVGNLPLYEISSWYPCVAIYDDVLGWHTAPPMAGIDRDYGDFTLEVTLPSKYIVASTGTLENPTEVLPAPIARKLVQAVTADTIVHVITRDELVAGTARPTKAGMLTWKFRAQNVTDAEWAATEDYLWDGTGWRGILLQAFYRTENPPIWERSAEVVRQAIQEHSEHWGMYPYPQFTLADARDPGFAFSMGAYMNTTFAASFGPLNPNSFLSTIMHEVGHQWFPLMVGSSEVAHPWISEGFATLLQFFGEKRFYPTEYEQMQGFLKIRGGLSGEKRLEPVDSLKGNVISGIYGPPAAMLTLLRQYVLGPQLFDSAMRTYVRRWSFKHPTATDFFRTMEDVSKRKLDWFWREWVYMPQTYDLSIDSVTQTRQGNDTRISVVYRNNGTGVLPIIATLTYSDSTNETLIQPAESWQAGPVQTVVYRAQGKTLTKVEIDASHWLPDENQANNVWVQPDRP